jgi:hypothetical protein
MSHTLLSYTLPIAEVFTSPDTDPPMTFLRLASPYDTDYQNMDIVKITSFIPPHIRHVSISGGEATAPRPTPACAAWPGPG